MRDQAWLDKLSQTIWDEHFQDVKRHRPITVKFGRRARNRLGSIIYDNKTHQVIIRLTGLFRDPDIPEMVVKATLVHEFCHYAHGFHSGLEQQFKHPHAGGVIRREFADRGLEELYLAQKRWLKANWLKTVKRHYPELFRRRQLRYRLRII